MNPSFIARYNKTNEKLDILRKHFNSVRDLRGKQIIEERKCVLIQENAELESYIKHLKKELSDAEILNGKKQVLLPSDKVTSSLNVNTPQPPGDTVKTKNPTDNQPRQDKKSKANKGNKVKKPEEPIIIDVSRLDLRVGCIVSAEKHPDADSLYVEQIDTGEENPRTVVSGLVHHIPLEQMQNRMVVLLMNLKPAKMRGVLSQAMVMCGSSPDKVEIIDPPIGSVPGDRVTFNGYPGEPDKQLNPKKKVWEGIQPDLHTDASCVACYKGAPFTVEGKGVCKVQTMSKSSIK